MKSNTMITPAPVSPELLASIPALPISQVYRTLGAQPQGLTQTEAEQRLAIYGRNVIRKVKGKPLWLKFVVNFTHLMAILLWIGGFIALAAQLPELAIAIWLVSRRLAYVPSSYTSKWMWKARPW